MSIVMKPISEINKKYTTILLFLIYFVTSLFLIGDYGISWDETVQHLKNGKVNFDYIFKGDLNELLLGNEKYHGPFFEVFLYGLTKLLKLTDTRYIYLCRHFFTFLLFYISTVFFYKTIIKIFGNWELAIIGTLALILSPRIFVESFYNSKDIVFLSFYIISTYSLYNFLNKKTLKTAVVHGIFCAILVDIRIVGIIIPMITICAIILKLWLDGGLLKKAIINGFVFISVFVIFMVFFWPVLWEGPFTHFIRAFSEMRKYHWFGHFFYLGQLHSSLDIPWHYIPVWLLITTPIYVIALFFFGLGFYLIKFFKSPKALLHNYFNDLIFISLLLSPILMVILLKSVVYDGWRHLYFIYPCFVLVAIRGVDKLIKSISVLQQNKINYSKIIYIIVLFFNINAAYIIFQYHPYQYIYFNKFLGDDYNKIKSNFDMDYWGLSYFDGLKYILEHDKSPTIKIRCEEGPGEDYLQLIPKENRKRLQYVKENASADYVLSIYRLYKNPLSYPKYFSVNFKGAEIMTVYKIK